MSTDPKMNPWHPIQEPVTLKHLGKLLEELGELTAAVSRCVIQGVDEVEPVTKKSNRLWLTEEIADVTANIYLVINHLKMDVKFIDARCERKIEQLRTWHEMA